MYRCVQGRGISRPMCTYALTLSLFIFLSYSVLFYLQKFNLTLTQKECVCQKWLFFSNEINFSKYAFSTLNWFSESKLAKMFLILVKQNLMYTLYFSDTLAQHGSLFDKVFYIEIYRAFFILLLLLLLLLNVIAVTVS